VHVFDRLHSDFVGADLGPQQIRTLVVQPLQPLLSEEDRDGIDAETDSVRAQFPMVAVRRSPFYALCIL